MTPNKERCYAVAAAIEREAATFDMEAWFGCDSPRCIAGHAVAMYSADKNYLNMSGIEIDYEASELLGVSRDVFRWTKWPIHYRDEYRFTGRKGRAAVAAKLLRAVAENPNEWEADDTDEKVMATRAWLGL